MPDSDFLRKKSGFGEPRYVEPRRFSLRLPGFDYSTPGPYFITICARDRRCILAEFDDIITACWNEIPKHFPHVKLDSFVVMPNHVHGILILDERVRPISVVIGAFKAAASRRVGKSIWQRNYWEHIIRSGKALDRIRQYIEDNPAALIPWMHAVSRPCLLIAPGPAGGPEPSGF